MLARLWTISVLLLVFHGSLMAQDAGQIIQRVRDRLEKVNNYEARATMTLDVPYMKVPASEVSILFTKPDHLEVRQDKGISIVPKGGLGANLNSLIFGGRYASIYAGTAKLDGREVSLIKLLPLDETADVVVSTLYIDTRDFLVLKAITTTRNNGTYHILLQYGKYASWGLPDEVTILFDLKDYKLPSGLSFDYDGAGNSKENPRKTNGTGRLILRYSLYLVNRKQS